MTKEMRPRCGAKLRAGGKGTCSRPAGSGTDHLGFGRCKHHGGATKNGKIAAAKLQAKAELHRLNMPVDLPPHEALLLCVRLAAAEVFHFSKKIELLDPGAITGKSIRVTRRRLADGRMEIEQTVGEPQLHIWIKLRQDALDRLARFSKMCLDVGVAERQIKLAENWGNLLAPVLQHLLDVLVLTPEQKQRAPHAVRSALTLMEKQERDGIAPRGLPRGLPAPKV